MKYIADINNDSELTKFSQQLDDISEESKQKFTFIKKQAENAKLEFEEKSMATWDLLIKRLKELNLIDSKIKSKDDPEFYFHINDSKQIIMKRHSEDEDPLAELLGKLGKFTIKPPQ